MVENIKANTTGIKAAESNVIAKKAEKKVIDDKKMPVKVDQVDIRTKEKSETAKDKVETKNTDKKVQISLDGFKDKFKDKKDFDTKKLEEFSKKHIGDIAKLINPEKASNTDTKDIKDTKDSKTDKSDKKDIETKTIESLDIDPNTMTIAQKENVLKYITEKLDNKDLSAEEKAILESLKSDIESLGKADIDTEKGNIAPKTDEVPQQASTSTVYSSTPSYAQMPLYNGDGAPSTGSIANAGSAPAMSHAPIANNQPYNYTSTPVLKHDRSKDAHKIPTQDLNFRNVKSLSDLGKMLARWHIDWVEGRSLSKDPRDPAHKNGIGSIFGITQPALESWKKKGLADKYIQEEISKGKPAPTLPNTVEDATFTEDMAIAIYADKFFTKTIEKLGFNQYTEQQILNDPHKIQVLSVAFAAHKHNPRFAFKLIDKYKSGAITDPDAMIKEYHNFLMNTGQTHYYKGWTRMVSRVQGLSDHIKSQFNTVTPMNITSQRTFSMNA